ncbi:uncharacterized protein LOC135279016 [Passer domesticus]|uniref:uncharacterized protein LOC135279016 n=1 Tax=Passer domesticus TaxID=48849 RepID=UPI0030FEB285
MREPLPTGSGRVSRDHRESATSGAQGQRGAGRGAGAAEPPGGGGVSPGRWRARSPGARGALTGPGELRLPAHPVPGRKVIRPLAASLSLRFCSAARYVTGFRLAACQRERTSTPHVGKKFGAGSITLPGWLGAAAALPSLPRLPASKPEHGSAATSATGARPAPLFRAASDKERPKGSQRSEGQAALCLAKALRAPGPAVPHVRASSSAHGALPEMPRGHGPPRRTALQ